MRVLITGAAGFIGSSVAEQLIARGDHVIGLDNFDRFYDRSIKEANLKTLREEKNFSFTEGDILDQNLVEELLKKTDRVIHLAALAGVRPSIATPERYMKVNVEGTAGIIEACKRASINRIVIASSSSVYGVRSKTPFNEDDPCNSPASPYAASKRATELIASTANHLHDIGISVLRFFTVYGPRQRPEMAIHKFVRHIFAGENIPMFGDGASARDYTYIDDIVDGTIAALDNQDGNFHIYNLGGDHSISLKTLIDTIAEVTGEKAKIERLPWQAGDVPITSADIKKSQRELGYNPKVSIRDGIERFVDWYKATQL